MRSTSSRTRGNAFVFGKYSCLKISPRRFSSSSPNWSSSSRERKTGNSWSPPLPICARTAENSICLPYSSRARCHASACLSTVSTSVPSTSKITVLIMFLFPQTSRAPYMTACSHDDLPFSSHYYFILFRRQHLATACPIRVLLCCRFCLFCSFDLKLEGS